MYIRITRDTETMRYAAEELQKYLLRMDDVCATVTTDQGTDGITLGLLCDLSLDESDVQDAIIDDVIDARVEALSGYIAGSNERSVLMGVYNYLKSAGCMWVRPGDEGAYIPRHGMRNHTYTSRQKADYPFRGECIEGAVSFEHVRDMILWMPKVGMNMFMMEQVIPYNYMSRWYKHAHSTVKTDDGTTFEQVGEYVACLEKTIKKCGLQLHALGHGYQLEPYGIHYKTYADVYELSEQAREATALVKGERGLFKNSPNFTQICLSNDRARADQVNWLVSYLERKPYIDFLHVWLADAVGNQCECENCRKRRPTDFYVQMLNELDAALTARGIDTRIVFIMYTDTFWAPEHEKFNNPARFVMTTAPTGRNYNETYSPARHEGELYPYERNNLNLNLNFAMALSFMDKWKPVFDGPRFTYEYYLYTDHFMDPGHMSISEHIFRDIGNLAFVEFDGIMSDQTQRSFFPTGLPMAIVGEAQFNKHMDYNAFVDAYFAAAYGKDADVARAYCEGVTALFDPEATRARDNIVMQDTGTGAGERVVGIRNNRRAGERLLGTDAFLDQFRAAIEQNAATCEDPCHRRSWELLVYHMEHVRRMAKFYIALSRDDDDTANAVLEDMIDWHSHTEDVLHPYFDMLLYRQRMKQLIKRK